MGGVESAVEPDLKVDAGFLYHRQRPVHLFQIMGDGFLAEDGLAGQGGSDHKVGMGVGAGTDRHRFDFGIVENAVDRVGDRDSHLPSDLGSLR